MRVLSFDVGIKNLAWCLLETLPPPIASASASSLSSVADVEGISGDAVPVHPTPKPKSREECVDVCWKVHDWGVWDLRMDTEDERFHPACCMEKTGSGKDCNREPVYVDMSGGECLGGICKIHARRTTVPYTSDDIKGVSKKMLGDLRKMAEEFGLDVRGKLKKEIISGITEAMSRRYLFKIPAFKKAKTVTLGDIHDRIIQRIQDIHSSADVVLIENQPVKMNAAMKSVQMILWTTLRSRMLENGTGTCAPDIRFINASKKLMVLPDNQTPYWGIRIMDNTTATRLARERNYAERKHESIARVEYLLRISSQKDHLEWFLANSKKDDLADCLLMCLYGACEKQGFVGTHSGTQGGDSDFDMEVDEILREIGGEGSPALGPAKIPAPSPSPSSLSLLSGQGRSNPREMSPLMLGMSGSGSGPSADVLVQPLPPPSYLGNHMSRRARQTQANIKTSARGSGRKRRVKDISGGDSETLEV